MSEIVRCAGRLAYVEVDFGPWSGLVLDFLL
jgi:hypothetical protein